MKGVKGRGTDATVTAYQAALALEPVVEKYKKGAPGAVQELMEMSIPLRPVQWWNNMYIQELRILCEAMYLCSHYHRKEMDAIHAGDIDLAVQMNKLANSKVPIIKGLQATLQLTPSMLHGQAIRHEGASVISAQVHELLADVNDLYA